MNFRNSQQQKTLGNVRTLALAVAAAFTVFLLWRNLGSARNAESQDDVDDDIHEAEAGDLLLFNRATGLNQLITWFTSSPFYHVGIYAGDGYVIEARPRGVVKRDLNGPEGDKWFTVIDAEVFGGRDTGIRALDWAERQVGSGYDPVNAAVIVLDRMFSCCACNHTLPDRWACGEFIVAALHEAGAQPFPEKPATAVVPADFAKFL